MNNELNNSAGEENPTQREEDLALWIDHAILMLLGVNAEITDDLIKVWPKGVVPDETNWLAGDRFSQSVDECTNIINGVKGRLVLHEDGGEHWAVVAFPNGTVTTDRASSKEMAAAFAVYAVLYGLRKAADKS
jgi:hypothetical protein